MIRTDEINVHQLYPSQATNSDFVLRIGNDQPGSNGQTKVVHVAAKDNVGVYSPKLSVLADTILVAGHTGSGGEPAKFDRSANIADANGTYIIKGGVFNISLSTANEKEIALRSGETDTYASDIGITMYATDHYNVGIRSSTYKSKYNGAYTISSIKFIDYIEESEETVIACSSMLVSTPHLNMYSNVLTIRKYNDCVTVPKLSWESNLKDATGRWLIKHGEYVADQNLTD